MVSRFDGRDGAYTLNSRRGGKFNSPSHKHPWARGAEYYLVFCMEADARGRLLTARNFFFSVLLYQEQTRHHTCGHSPHVRAANRQGATRRRLPP